MYLYVLESIYFLNEVPRKRKAIVIQLCCVLSKEKSGTIFDLDAKNFSQVHSSFMLKTTQTEMNPV